MRKKIFKYRRKMASRRQRHVRRLKIWSRHPFAVPFLTFLVLITATLGITYAFNRHAVARPDAFIVIISHDHQEQTVPTRESTVGTLLKKLNITLNQGDVVEPSQTTKINQDEFRINIYRALPVEIVDGTHHTFTFSASTTSRSIASQAGVVVYPEDQVTTVPTSNFVTQQAIGQQVIVNRSLPIDLNLYGTSVPTRTLAKTVGEFLKEKKIKLEKGDTIVPAQDSPLTAGQQVAIIRNGTHIETVTQAIATPVQTIQDPNLAFGTSAIRQQGSPGQQVITYQDTLQNNIVVSRTQLQMVITQPPVTQIVVIGTSLSGIKGDMALAGISPSDYQYADYIISNESGWCPTKWQGEIGYCPATFEPIHSIYDKSIGYGLGQSTPASNMAAFGSDWQTNPITQLKWANAYANSHYGSWAAAYQHWINHHWW